VTRKLACIAGVITLALTISDAFAQGIVVGPDDKFIGEQKLSVPYAFYNDSFGVAGGYVYGVTGYPQEHASLLTTAMAGTAGSGMLFLIGQNIRLPYTSRVFLDPVASIGYFGESEKFVNGNPRFAGDRAGSNDSDPDNYVEGGGWDNYFRMRFKYLLPIGHGEDQIISRYKLDHGILVGGASGGTSWNPFESGKSYLEFRPFYRYQEVDSDDVQSSSKTNGVDVSLFWDNRDYYQNPSKGNSIRFKVSRDFGWFDSTDSWTSVESEWDAYLSLGKSDWFRQRVIALNFWTSYSPTWDEQPDGDITHRPPPYTGATLGGLWRMRAYPSQRFNDQAAVYYSAELRMIPYWNPFDYWPWLQKHLGVQWIQLVPFAELGRVAPEWDVDRLHSDMKWDAGLGLRFLAMGIVARIDAAFSNEGVGVQMMISQPFQW